MATGTSEGAVASAMRFCPVGEPVRGPAGDADFYPLVEAAAMGFWSSLQPRSGGGWWSAVAVTFPELLRLQDLALLLLRLMVAIEFGASGYYHLRDPVGRS